uniref:Uncharacterized protein n=1 Tax=Spongospora subterranea TaxID=70186 RepID=A0A0H5R4K9_9EUKA|eukprot:CRZ03004.1 hypothetical protein [Spongospora subterranea]
MGYITTLCDQPTQMAMILTISAGILTLGIYGSNSNEVSAAMALLPILLLAAKSILQRILFNRSELAKQITEQWDRLPAHYIRSRFQCAQFISDSLASARDDKDGCEVRNIDDDECEKDASILLQISSAGQILRTSNIRWDLPLLVFESMLRETQIPDNDNRAVELVARLLNGRIIYLVGTFSPLNSAQTTTVLAICQYLNGLSGQNRLLRWFRCRNFVQRCRNEPRNQQIL